MTEHQVVSIPLVIGASALLLTAPSQWREGRVKHPSLVACVWLGLALASVWVLDRSGATEVFGIRIGSGLEVAYLFGPMVVALSIIVKNRSQPPSLWGLAIIGVSTGCLIAMTLIESRTYPQNSLGRQLREYLMCIPIAAWVTGVAWLAKCTYDDANS